MILSSLLISWIAVTVVLMVLIFVRRRMQAREVDWMPLTTTTEADIHNQEVIETKVHKLDPVIHVLEAVDVLLLAGVAALWIYQGISSVRW